MQELWPFVWLWVGEGAGANFGRALTNNIITIGMVKMRVNKSYNQLFFSWCWIKMFSVFLLVVFAWLLSLIWNTLNLGIFWRMGWHFLCSFPVCGSLITDIQTFMCKVYLEVFTCIIDLYGLQLFQNYTQTIKQLKLLGSCG